MIENKNINIFDLGKPVKYDKGLVEKKNRVIISDPYTGEILHEDTNIVQVAGSAFTAQKHFNINAFKTPSYNEVLGLDNSSTEPYSQPGLRRDEIVCLFCVGDDGCGPEQHQIYDVKYASWIAPESLIPFRYRDLGNDLSTEDRSKYFGRKQTSDKIFYYFKAYELEPEFIQQYTDGTPIGDDVYTSTKEEEIESYIRLKMLVSEEDLIEFFVGTGNVTGNKVSSMSLLTAWKTTVGGFEYYQDIRPLTKFHFSNESLNGQKALDITYLLYY